MIFIGGMHFYKFYETSYSVLYDVLLHIFNIETELSNRDIRFNLVQSMT
jgi:hypothetical protein